MGIAALLALTTQGLMSAAPASAMPYQPRTTTLSVTITRKPPAFTASTTAGFRWTLIGRARSVTCKLDAHPAGRCTKRRVVYKHLTEGQHRFLLTVVGSRKRRLSVTWVVDHTPPTDPTSVTGGSATWTDTAPTLTASGGTDAGSGLRGYEYRASTDGGVTWTPPVLENPAKITVPGTDTVQFRSVDRAGNVSAWAPAVSGPANTVMLDVAAPAVPVVSGGSASW